VNHAADPRPVATGDRQIDTILRRTDAMADPDALVPRPSTMFDSPEQEIRQVRDVRRFDGETDEERAGAQDEG
jgi:hypothetical protein